MTRLTDTQSLGESMPPSCTDRVVALTEKETAPEISVIIVSWNTREFLEECLQSLSSGITRRCEVIVVDNASNDGSAEMVATRFPAVELIQTGRNLGFSKANNIGIARSRGKYIALVNSDVHVLPGCLDALAHFLDRHPQTGMVGPRVMYGDRRLQSSARRFPGLWNTFCQTVHLNRLFPRSPFFGGEHMFYFSYDRVCSVEVLVGCFMLVRKSSLAHFGLLDEDFFMYGEDIDWCRRCTKSGWNVMFCPDAEAIHYGGASSANDPTRFEIAQLDARLKLWRKHHVPWRTGGLFVMLHVQCLLRLLAAVLRRMSGNAAMAARARNQIACLRALWGLMWTPVKSAPADSRRDTVPTTS